MSTSKCASECFSDKTYCNEWIQYFCTGLTILFLTACTSSGEIRIDQPKQNKMSPDSTVALSVSPPEDIDQEKKFNKEEVEDATRRLQNELFGRLISEGVFKQVFHQGEAADYDMEVSILSADEVSQAARFWFGILAGPNTIAANVALYNQKAKSLVTSFYVAGESAIHPLSSENDIDDAIEELVDKIIFGLQ